MDISKFKDQKTGRIVAISTPEKDFAFVPDPLPAKWDFETKLWPLLAEAKQCLGLLNGVATILPNPQLFLKPLQRIESLTSSRLEGTFATAQELMLFELNPKDSQSAHDPSNAWREVNNYNLALAQGFRELEKLPLCLRLVNDLHKTLLDDVRGSSKNPGQFRTHQVHIGSNRRYVPPPQSEMMNCLYALEEYLNGPDDTQDPLVRCFIAHYQIEAIHPFSDGNGRIGRVLLSLMIYKWCKLEMPWLYLSPFFERYKDEYIDNLFKVSAEGAWSNWIEFCLRGVIDQATKAARTCKKLQLIRLDMHARTESDCSARIHSIIEGLFDSPLVRVADLARKLNVRYQTAKADVSYLVKKGILSELDDMNVKTFYAPEIFTTAYVENQDATESASEAQSTEGIAP